MSSLRSLCDYASDLRHQGRECLSTQARSGATGRRALVAVAVDPKCPSANGSWIIDPLGNVLRDVD
jgi:hypothetical protein